MRLLTLFGLVITTVAVSADVPLLTGVAAIAGNQNVSTTATGTIGVRREIRDLQTNYPDIFNIYILALREWMAMNQTETMSFYQIAGIHGLPYKAWGGDTSPVANSGAGYCTHWHPLFFGWHRAYTGLFEQEMYKHAQTVASQFPDALKDQYTKAAQAFRAPYWDWALGGNDQMPDVFFTATIQVVMTDGTQQTIDNPLYQYKFHDLIPGDFTATDDESHWNTTMRWPTTHDASAQSQQDKIKTYWSDVVRGQAHDALSDAFMNSAGSYEQFSSAVENPHGYIHFLFGGEPNAIQGHMSPLQYSSYDPAFMLHHTNVDRLYALFQALHPDKVWGSTMTLATTYTMAAGTVTGDTPLTPFFNTANTFWTTNQLLDTKTLGYVYPETANENHVNTTIPLRRADTHLQEVVAAIVAEKYTDGAAQRLRSYSNSSTEYPTNNSTSASNDTPSANASNNMLSANASSNTLQSWRAVPQITWSELPSSFVIRFYLVGQFSSDRPVEVGSWGIMGMYHAPPNGTQVTQVEQNPSGSVPISAALLDRVEDGTISGMTPEIVVPYLSEALTWKVFFSNGTLIPRETLTGLTVTVVTAELQVPPNPKKPVVQLQPHTAYPQITDKNYSPPPPSPGSCTCPS